MKKGIKGWLIIAAFLILSGSILFAGMMMSLKWDFTKLGTVHYETKNHQIEESFSKISIETKTAKIDVYPINEQNARVECLEAEKVKHTVLVYEDTLVIQADDQRKWYDHISVFDFKTPKLSLYLPQKSYDELFINTRTGDIHVPAEFSFEILEINGSTADVDSAAKITDQIKIELDTGNLKLENLEVNTAELLTDTGDVALQSVASKGEMELKTDTGKIRISEMDCKKLSIESGTGDIRLKKTIAKEQISIESNTGDIDLEECDGGEIYIKTSTGDVNGRLLSEKIFITETDTGTVKIPETITGGRCEIETNTGDIKMNIAG